MLAIGLGLAALVAVCATPILVRIRRRTQSNLAFLAKAIGSGPLAPGAPVRIACPSVPSGSHAVWLDLDLSGPRAPSFQLALAVRIGDRTILDGTYPVTFDEDEHDAHGLPSSYGVTALNTKVMAMPRSARIRTVLRAVTFDGPTASAPVDVQATLTPGDGVTIQRAVLLVTSPSSPPM